MSTFDTTKGGLVSYIFGILIEILYNIIFYTKFGCIGLVFMYIIWIIYFDRKQHRGINVQDNLFYNLVIGLNLMANYTINEITDGNRDFSIGLGIGAILYLLGVKV